MKDYGIAKNFGTQRVVEKDDSCNSVLTLDLLQAAFKKVAEVSARDFPTVDTINRYNGKFVMQDTSAQPLSWTGGYGVSNTLAQQLGLNPPASPKPAPTMTRLTTFEDWTILLEDGKLVAVNSSGNTVRAKGALLSAGGRAWMYTGGKLWSGELERHETEQEIRISAAREAEQKVYLSYQKKLDAIAAKESKLIDARDEALRNL